MPFWKSLVAKVKRVKIGIRFHDVEIPIKLEFRPPPEGL